jgi:hypothetical protein
MVQRRATFSGLATVEAALVVNELNLSGHAKVNSR